MDTQKRTKPRDAGQSSAVDNLLNTLPSAQVTLPKNDICNKKKVVIYFFSSPEEAKKLRCVPLSIM